MKTISEIINQDPVFLHNWKRENDVYEDFSDNGYDEAEVTKFRIALGDITILFASYGTDNYSGDAFVLIERNGKLYEINGYHCSCYGLEGQWEEEEVVLEEIANRLITGEMGTDDWAGNEFNKELRDFLGI